jgi:hypothetical protein
MASNPRNPTAFGRVISGFFLRLLAFPQPWGLRMQRAEKKISFQKNGFGQDLNPAIPILGVESASFRAAKGFLQHPLPFFVFSFVKEMLSVSQHRNPYINRRFPIYLPLTKRGKPCYNAAYSRVKKRGRRSFSDERCDAGERIAEL